MEQYEREKSQKDFEEAIANIISPKGPKVS